MPTPEHLPLTVGGQWALARLGSRVYAVYTGAALVGMVLLRVEPAGGDPSARFPLDAGFVTLLICAGCVVAVVGIRLVAALAPDASGRTVGRLRPLLCLVAGHVVLLWLVLATAPPVGWGTRFVVGWLVGGAALGAALAAGPASGLALLVTLDAVYASTWALAGHAPDIGVFADTPVSVLVGCVVHVGATRGFARTQAATLAAEESRRAVKQARRDLTARRALDRELHDTLLSTLTLVAMGGSGASSRGVRELCARDLEALDADRWGTPGAMARDVVPDRAPGGDSVESLVARLRTETASAGLDLRTHVIAHEAGRRRALSPTATAAWQGAVRECVTNIRKHAGVEAADLVVDMSGADLMTIVLDEGIGFCLDDVAPERLGLASSVRDRLRAVGGGAKVHSTLGQGTVVELRVPWEAP